MNFQRDANVDRCHTAVPCLGRRIFHPSEVGRSAESAVHSRRWGRPRTASGQTSGDRRLNAPSAYGRSAYGLKVAL
jgi:hypothetical protein